MREFSFFTILFEGAREPDYSVECSFLETMVELACLEYGDLIKVGAKAKLKLKYIANSIFCCRGQNIKYITILLGCSLKKDQRARTIK